MNTIKKKYHKRKPSRKHNRVKVKGGDADLAPGFYDTIEAQPSNTKNLYDKLNSFNNRLNFFSKIETTNLRNYKNVNKLGTGGFGKVEVWENKQDKKKSFAIKTQKYTKIDDNYKTILCEIEMLKYIKNLDNHSCKDSILCFKGVYDDKPNKIIYIATDYDTNYIGLDKIIDHLLLKNRLYVFNNELYKEELTQETTIKGYDDYKNHSIFCIKILFEIFKAITYLHDHKIVHNDIKPDNILCNIIFKNNKIDIKKYQDIKVKIIDFGLSCLNTETDNKILICDKSYNNGTPGYMDPIKNLGNTNMKTTTEYNNMDNYNKHDYWALGIIFKELICTNTSIEKLWKEKNIILQDNIFNFLNFNYYEKNSINCKHDNLDKKTCEIYSDKLKQEYKIYYYFYDLIADTEDINDDTIINNINENYSKLYTLDSYTEIHVVTITETIQKYRRKFQILKDISNKYYNYTVENNIIPFPRIEYLLNPRFSERKLI